MKVSQISEPTAEQLQNLYNEYPADIDSLLSIVGQLVDRFNQLANKNISLNDNIDCEIRTLSHKAGTPLQFSRGKSQLPKQILIGRVVTAGTAPTSSVQILDWTIKDSLVTVTNIVGLTAAQVYDITLTLFY